MRFEYVSKVILSPENVSFRSTFRIVRYHCYIKTIAVDLFVNPERMFNPTIHAFFVSDLVLFRFRLSTTFLPEILAPPVRLFCRRFFLLGTAWVYTFRQSLFSKFTDKIGNIHHAITVFFIICCDSVKKKKNNRKYTLAVSTVVSHS